MDIQIRPAGNSDIPAIYELVKELALFEKEPESVTASLQMYYDAFTDDIFSCLVAVVDEEVVGMTLFYKAFSTWRGKMLHLEDFVVHPQWRSKGIGQKLFDAFLDEARTKACTMVKWEVLDWNEGAVRFYERNNAIIEKQWWDGKIIF